MMIGDLFTYVDSMLAGVLSDEFRMTVWAASAGVAAMVLYWLISPQRKLKEIDIKIREIQKSLQAHQGDFGSAWILVRQKLYLAFRRLGLVLIPTVISGIFPLLILIWMEATYAHQLPNSGERIQVETAPTEVSVQWESTASAEWDEVNRNWAIAWPDSGSQLTLRDDQGLDLFHVPPGAPTSSITRRKWHHSVIANPAGYLPEDSQVESVTFHYAERTVVPFGPTWMRSWLTFALLITFVSALITKLVLRVK